MIKKLRINVDGPKRLMSDFNIIAGIEPQESRYIWFFIGYIDAKTTSKEADTLLLAADHDNHTKKTITTAVRINKFELPELAIRLREKIRTQMKKEYQIELTENLWILISF